MEHPALALKDLCHSAGIYNFAALGAFLCIAPGRTQSEVAELSRQSKSSVSQWYILLEMQELITVTRVNRKGEGKRHRDRHCTVAITPQGVALTEAVRKLFAPSLAAHSKT